MRQRRRIVLQPTWSARPCVPPITFFTIEMACLAISRMVETKGGRFVLFTCSIIMAGLIAIAFLSGW